MPKCPRCGRFGEKKFTVITRNNDGDVVTRECIMCRTRICHLKYEDRDETYILEFPYAKNSWIELEDYKPAKVIWSVS